jgi:hydroxymethylpyrimidine pyrophosphatase-like HAD family hydrolase
MKKMIELERMGASLFFASGRTMQYVTNLINKIEVNPRLICAENGGHIWDCSWRSDIIWNDTTDSKLFIELIQNEPLPPGNQEDKLTIWSRRFGNNWLEAKRIIGKV